MGLKEGFNQLVKQQMYERIAQVAIPTLIGIKKAPDTELFKYDFSDGANTYEMPVNNMSWTTNIQPGMTESMYKEIIDKISSTLPIDIMSEQEITEANRLGFL
jgi:hypothetical protein